MTLLPTVSVLGSILSNSYFYLFYIKVDYCKIANSIIKTAILSDSKYFLICIYVSEVLLVAFVL